MPKPLWDLVLFQAGLMFASLLIAAILARRNRRRPTLERILIPAMPILIAMLAWHWFVAIAVLPYGGPWSAIRLAPSMSLRYGYKLYEPQGIGPVLGWIYPPMAPLAYLPVTFLSEPGAAVIAGRCLTLLFYYAPAVWLIFSSIDHPGPRGWWTRVLLFFTFALLTSQSRALSYCSTEIHADATALGVGAMAIGLLGRATSGSGWAVRVAAALLGALAVWSKQLNAPLFAALPVWVLVRDGIKPALMFAAICAAGAMTVSLLIIIVFGYDALFYNIFTIPSRHPWTTTRPLAIWSTFISMQTDHIVLLVLIGGGLVVWFGSRAEPSDRTAQPISSPPWPLFLMVGLLECPLAVLGLIKVGGYDNNLSYCLDYLALGGVLLLASLVNRQLTANGQ